MPSSLRANSSEPASILIVAAAGRALAAAARRSGYEPRVVDFFGDSDTRALAAATAQIADPAGGFETNALLAHLHALAAAAAPAGLVYGSGFEDRNDILEILAQHFRVFGNDAQTVARAKDPRVLAALCRDLDIPHPQISFDPPRDRENWLVKRQGGGGGVHVRSAESEEMSSQDYFQRRVAGTPVSVLLLGAGGAAQILGTSSQWTAPWPGMPFRFGGAVRPVDAPSAPLAALGDAAQKIARGLGLVGLNSLDFLAEATGFHLIEVNPRPGATLDIFADADGALFAAHVAACRGHLPPRPLVFTKAAATAIAYAPREIPSMPALVWPDWCKDRQRPGTYLRAGDPVCTILAEAETGVAARAAVGERLAWFDDYLMREARKESAA
jgi:uncharacterized protein